MNYPEIVSAPYDATFADIAGSWGSLRYLERNQFLLMLACQGSALSSSSSEELSSSSSEEPAPIISGNPYPGETLTSSISGQWYVDDVESGSPSATYTVDVRDIGKSVRCGDSSPVTIWHPTDVTSNMILLTPNVGALHSIEPDVEATDGQTVRRILDQSGNGWHADQATGANQPTRQVSEVGGNDTLLFDGTNDFMEFSGGALGLFRNRGYGYIIAACRDLATSGGSPSHPVFSVYGVSSYRLLLFTRNESNIFICYTRRTDVSTPGTVDEVNNSNHNVLTSEALWENGDQRLRINGSESDNSALSDSGLSQDSDSNYVFICRFGTNYFPGDISCLMALSPDTALSAVNLARLERYAYLCGPGPTEVTLDPSDPWA